MIACIRALMLEAYQLAGLTAPPFCIEAWDTLANGEPFSYLITNAETGRKIGLYIVDGEDMPTAARIAEALKGAVANV